MMFPAYYGFAGSPSGALPFAIGNTNSSTSKTFSHACVLGSNLLVLTVVAAGTSATPLFTATYNGVSMTQIVQQIRAAEFMRLQSFTIDANALTFDKLAHDIVVSSATTTDFWAASGDFVQADIDGTPIGTIATVSAIDTRNNLDVTCATGDYVWGVCALNLPNAQTAQDSQTEIFNSTGSVISAATGQIVCTPSTQSMDWTFSSSNIRSHGFAVKGV